MYEKIVIIIIIIIIITIIIIIIIIIISSWYSTNTGTAVSSLSAVDTPQTLGLQYRHYQQLILHKHWDCSIIIISSWYPTNTGTAVSSLPAVDTPQTLGLQYHRPRFQSLLDTKFYSHHKPNLQIYFSLANTRELATQIIVWLNN